MTRYTKLGRKTHEDATRFEDFAAGQTSTAGNQRRRAVHGRDLGPGAADLQLRQRRSEHRRDRREKERERDKVCYNCRKEGHRAERCPELVSGGKCGTTTTTICYRCGLDDHSLKQCRLPEKVGLPHAVCFVCKGKGHLAGACPSNAKGVYPDGGCCKICRQVDHLAKDCPLPNEVRLGTMVGEGRGHASQGADEDDFHIIARPRMKRPAVSAGGGAARLTTGRSAGARPANTKKVVSF